MSMPNHSSSLVRWSVLRDGEEIDRVSFKRGISAKEVRESLIRHDNFDEGITVRKAASLQNNSYE